MKAVFVVLLLLGVIGVAMYDEDRKPIKSPEVQICGDDDNCISSRDTANP